MVGDPVQSVQGEPALLLKQGVPDTGLLIWKLATAAVGAPFTCKYAVAVVTVHPFVAVN